MKYLNLLNFPALLALTVSANAEEPLFESEEVLAITIEAPMRELISKRANKPEWLRALPRREDFTPRQRQVGDL